MASLRHDPAQRTLREAAAVRSSSGGFDPDAPFPNRAIAIAGSGPACEPEYEQTVESWRSLLKARTPADAKAQGSLLERVLGWRRAAPEKPTSQVVDYAGAPDALTRYRGAVMAVGLLELIAGFVDHNLPFTKPITLKAMGCGEQNAFWDNRDRQLVLCYELVSAYVGIALETPDLPPIR